jgi:hypothetical protein
MKLVSNENDRSKKDSPSSLLSRKVYVRSEWIGQYEYEKALVCVSIYRCRAREMFALDLRTPMSSYLQRKGERERAGERE